jgi:CheY-like chemotaxis protein
VLIADDDARTRDDVRRSLRKRGIRVCAEASNAVQAVQLALETRPDICLLEVRMPGGGVAAAWEIAARVPTRKPDARSSNFRQPCMRPSQTKSRSPRVSRSQRGKLGKPLLK